MDSMLSPMSTSTHSSPDASLPELDATQPSEIPVDVRVLRGGKRCVIVSGTGGAGKSLVATSLALRLSSLHGKRVLLVGQRGVSHLLGETLTRNEPRRVHLKAATSSASEALGSLDVVEIGEKRRLGPFDPSTYLQPPSLAGGGGYGFDIARASADVVSYARTLLTVAPGAQQAMDMLEAVTNASEEYDFVVVDSPSFEHMMRLIPLARLLQNYIQVLDGWCAKMKSGIMIAKPLVVGRSGEATWFNRTMEDVEWMRRTTSAATTCMETNALFVTVGTAESGSLRDVREYLVEVQNTVGVKSGIVVVNRVLPSFTASQQPQQPQAKRRKRSGSNASMESREECRSRVEEMCRVKAARQRKFIEQFTRDHGEIYDVVELPETSEPYEGDRDALVALMAREVPKESLMIL